MTKPRADLGFASELESFDPQAWIPPASRVANHPPKAEIAQAASAAGFRSREPVASPPPAGQPQRRRRTGRNAQFNIKARPETIEAFCAIADANGWGFGETLERAVVLLQREHGAQK